MGQINKSPLTTTNSERARDCSKIESGTCDTLILSNCVALCKINKIGACIMDSVDLIVTIDDAELIAKIDVLAKKLDLSFEGTVNRIIKYTLSSTVDFVGSVR